jgi:hypothetical protein
MVSITAVISAFLLSNLFLYAKALSLRGSNGIDHQEPNHHRALQDNQIALYLIKDTEDGKTLQQGKRPDRTDNIQLNDGTIYEVKKLKLDGQVTLSRVLTAFVSLPAQSLFLRMGPST